MLWIMGSKATLPEAILYFADFEHCLQFMIELRWPDGKIACPQRSKIGR